MEAVVFLAILVSMIFWGLDVGRFQQRWRIGRKWRNRHKTCKSPKDNCTLFSSKQNRQEKREASLQK